MRPEFLQIGNPGVQRFNGRIMEGLKGEDWQWRENRRLCFWQDPRETRRRMFPPRLPAFWEWYFFALNRWCFCLMWVIFVHYAGDIGLCKRNAWVYFHTWVIALLCISSSASHSSVSNQRVAAQGIRISLINDKKKTFWCVAPWPTLLTTSEALTGAVNTWSLSKTPAPWFDIWNERAP